MTQREKTFADKIETPAQADADRRLNPMREETEAAVTGGVDYSRQSEITQDMMTDELFAAVRRGDTQHVYGLTSAPNMKSKAPRAFNGVLGLLAQTEEKSVKSRKPRRAGKLGLLADAGLAAQLMFETNGNEELARLLLIKLKANTLMTMEGNYADNIAREMGAYGLSNQIEQKQRDAAAQEAAYVEDTKEASKFFSFKSIFGGDKEDASPRIEVTPITLPAAETEEPSGRISGMASGLLSGIFSVFNRPQQMEVEAPAARLQLSLTPPGYNMTPRFAM